MSTIKIVLFSLSPVSIRNELVEQIFDLLSKLKLIEARIVMQSWPQLTFNLQFAKFSVKAPKII